MSTTALVYGITNCDTVKKSRTWFDEKCIVYHFHDFKKLGVPEQALHEWINTLGWEALVNKKGTTWRKLDAATQATVVDAESAIALMLAHCSVIKRPVVARGANITVGYVPEKW